MADGGNHARRHTPRGAAGGYPLPVTLIDFLHYGLVTLVGIAALATIWFACYVVYRLHND
ncbi:hypothetical protein GCM10023222_06500 [Saccharopolyspora cebuensis]